MFAVAVAALALALAAARVASISEVRRAENAEQEARLRRSQIVHEEQVREMEEKELREHLSYRGDPCLDCNTVEKMRQVLIDHVHAGTQASAQNYVDASNSLRRVRQAADAGDNPRGNNKRRYERHNERMGHRGLGARDNNNKRFHRGDPSDPLSGLRNVLRSHGFDTIPFTGAQEAHDFISSFKNRQEATPPPDPEIAADQEGGAE